MLYIFCGSTSCSTRELQHCISTCSLIQVIFIYRYIHAIRSLCSRVCSACKKALGLGINCLQLLHLYDLFNFKMQCNIALRITESHQVCFKAQWSMFLFLFLFVGDQKAVASVWKMCSCSRPFVQRGGLGSVLNTESHFCSCAFTSYAEIQFSKPLTSELIVRHR